MEWGEALAKTFLAESQAFGEDVLFRKLELKAIVGTSDETKALEMSGYFANQSLEVILPEYSLLGLSKQPEVNEVIETRGKGYRIHGVRNLADNTGTELTCELIPEYIPTSPNEPFLFTPRVVSNIQLGLLPELVTELVVLARPVSPSEVETEIIPRAPSDLSVSASYEPLAPSNLILAVFYEPLAPSNLVISSSPLEPSNLVIDRNPTAPSNLVIDRNPTAPSNLVLEIIPLAPSGITIDQSPIAPSTLIINRNPITPSAITIERSPTEPSNINTKVFFDPSQAQPEGWWDASDSSTLTISSGVVTQASDKSGNGYTLNVPSVTGATGPSIGNRTLNGLNVFEFTGANNNVLENNSFTWNQVTNAIGFAMVYRLDDDGLNDQDFIMSGTNTSSRIGIRRQLDGSWQLLVSGASLTTASKRGIEPVTQMMVAKFNTSNSFIRIDGNQEASGTIGNTNFSAVNISGNYINQQGVEGYIAEVIFFSDLSKTQEIEGYLSHKWGRTASLPATHPYKTIAP